MKVTVNISPELRLRNWRETGQRVGKRVTIEVADVDISPAARATIGMVDHVEMTDSDEHMDCTPYDEQFQAKVLAWLNASPARIEAAREKVVSRCENDRSLLPWGGDDEMKKIIESPALSAADALVQARAKAVLIAWEDGNKKKEKEAAKVAAEQAAWIQAHGSERLRLVVQEDLLDVSLAVYKDERLAHDLPGWEWDQDGETLEIRNPSLEALRDLRAEREANRMRENRIEDLKLIYMLVDELDENGDETGEAIGHVFLGGEYLDWDVRRRAK